MTDKEEPVGWDVLVLTLPEDVVVREHGRRISIHSRATPKSSKEVAVWLREAAALREQQRPDIGEEDD